MIEDAEAQGLLRPGQTVVELTSGNTGTGLAIVCAVKGYRFVAVMSGGNSVERARMMRGAGGRGGAGGPVPGVHARGKCPGGTWPGWSRRPSAWCAERSAFRADQFRLAGNFRAHYLHTGPEILEQAGCAIDGFCDFAGTGGSFAGCAAAFKERDPATRCYLVEPEGAAALSGGAVTHPSHPIQGGGYAMAEPELPGPRPGRRLPPGERRRGHRHRAGLARTEGIFAGFSSGANVAAALAPPGRGACAAGRWWCCSTIRGSNTSARTSGVK